MSKKGHPHWTIRMDEKKHSIINKAIKKVIDTEGFTGQSSRSKGLIYLANLYLHGPPKKEIPGAILDLEQRVDCGYLRKDYTRNVWVCDETVLKKRTNTVLGELWKDDENVLSKCLACLKKKKEIRDEKLDEILGKNLVADAIRLLKKLRRIDKDGFSAPVRICTARWYTEGFSRASEDNKTIMCHKLGKFVDIKTVCRETINPSTKAPPCESFFEFVHFVYLDDMEEFKEVDVAVGPTPCSAYGTSECPGAHQCTEDLHALAKMKKYCPLRYSPTMDIPLLEEKEESPKGVPLLEEQEESTE